MRRVLSASVETDWGGYRVRRDFHDAWSDYARVTRRSSGSWYCNTCFAPAWDEHRREECHTCQDWGGCGQDCTLSRIYCAGCGTSLTRLVGTVLAHRMRGQPIEVSVTAGHRLLIFHVKLLMSI